MLLQFYFRMLSEVLNTKSDGANRSNIFGITKVNHANAVCLVWGRVAFRLSLSIDSFARVQSVLLMSSLCLFNDLRCVFSS